MLKVCFSDEFETEVLFHIKKKSSMKTLKDLGAAAVVENMKNEIDIAKLEIPVTLFQDLVQAFRNDFSVKYYKSNIKEGTINQSNSPKRPNESNLEKQPKHKKKKVEIIEKKQKTKTKVVCAGCGKSFIRISVHKCKAIKR